MFVRHEDCALEDLGGGVRRRILAHEGRLMQVEVHFEAGAVGPLHRHPHEQLTYVLSGEFEFTIGDQTRVVRAGDTLYKRPGVEHGCVCRIPGVLLDTFTPQRDDFLRRAPSESGRDDPRPDHPSATPTPGARPAFDPAGGGPARFALGSPRR